MLNPPGNVMTGEEGRDLVWTKFRAGSLSLPRTRTVLFFRSILTMRPVVAMNIPSPARRFRSAAAAKSAVHKAIASIIRGFVQCDPSRIIALYYRYSVARTLLAGAWFNNNLHDGDIQERNSHRFNGLNGLKS